ncbi:hypothetical protein, partial [Sphingobium sp. AM]|uniref:hypothetical protein n=1 Tax=Sphingobium sp. AM TaxID=1176302 RepID=UPI0012903364
MAQKYYIYTPYSRSNPASADSINLIVQADEAVMALYPDLVWKYSGGSLTPATAPTGYDTLADLAGADAAALL